MSAGMIRLAQTVEVTEMISHEDHYHPGETYDIELDIIEWADGTKTLMKKP